MKRERRRLRQKPTRAELRAMGATPGLVITRYTPDGRATVQELTPESRPRPPFTVGLTDNTQTNEKEGAR